MERNKRKGQGNAGNAGSSGKDGDRESPRQGKPTAWIAAIAIAALILAILALLRGCGGEADGLFLDMPEYEESVGYEGSGDGGAARENRVELSVVPDFTVTEENKSFLIPYPDNAYDVEFSFVDRESGEERYHTARIRPGTVVSIPAYDFCDEGEHGYRIDVEVYDHDTHERVPGAVALEMKITKE